MPNNHSQSPLDQRQLDAIVAHGCQEPHCKHPEDHALVLAARCHLGQGTDAFYREKSGVLDISCHVCKKPVVSVRVGREDA